MISINLHCYQHFGRSAGLLNFQCASAAQPQGLINSPLNLKMYYSKFRGNLLGDLSFSIIDTVTI